MWIFGTLILASAVLLNSIEFSIQVGPAGPSSSPPPTAKGPAKPPPKPPRQPPAKKAKLAKGVPNPTPKPPEHPGQPHPAPQPGSPPHPGSSSANPPPAPVASPGLTKKGNKKPTKHNPDLGNWPRILKPGTELGIGSSAPMVATGYIRLDATYPISGTTLDRLGFMRLTINGFSGVELKFRKYTFSSAQNLVLFIDINIGEPSMIPDVEHIVIVNAQEWALAILMPSGFILGVYSERVKDRKKVNVISNVVDDLKGTEKEHVMVGLRNKITGVRYKMHETDINSLLESYGEKGGGGLKPQAPIPAKKRGRPPKPKQPNP